MTSLALCGTGAGAVAVIQALDRRGCPDPAALSGYTLALASPFAGVAAAAWWWRSHRWLSGAAAAAAAGCLGLALWGNLTDYIAWSNTPPGREVMYFGAFVAMFWSWALCAGLLAAGVTAWVWRRRARRESPAGPPGTW